jgi:hypothetical protein
MMRRRERPVELSDGSDEEDEINSPLDNERTLINDDEEEEIERINRRELSKRAWWFVSTAKPNHGVERALDSDMETYWQSDGSLPHFIVCNFHRFEMVDEVRIWLDPQNDESYSPIRLEISAGTSLSDMDVSKVCFMFANQCRSLECLNLVKLKAGHRSNYIQPMINQY